MIKKTMFMELTLGHKYPWHATEDRLIIIFYYFT